MPEAVIHPTPHELAAFGLGKLPERAAAVVAAHLDSCPACRKGIANVPPDSFLDKVRAAKQESSSFPPGLAGAGNAASSAGRPSMPAVSCPDVPPELARHPKYLILRELGRGGMGVVYQARHKEMDRQVVIKVINRSLLDRPDTLERFHREVRAAALLSHPNIVTAYDAEQIGESHMLVMEFVPGQSLAEVVQKKGPLPVANACHYARQVALGLQHAHERKMVHRDIKPQNLILSLKNQVKILDFGLAKVLREEVNSTGLTAHDVYMGTPDYCAPEQATDARNADTRADLYSLGCTLYYLLSGRPPFREDTVVKTILAHQQKQPRPLPELRPEVPAELWQVVKRLMAKEPGQRYPKPIEVAQALVPFIKPGAKQDAKGGSALPPGVGSPGKGTLIAAEASQIQKILREVPGKSPPKQMPAKAKEAAPFENLEDTSALPKKAKGARESRRRMPAGWYRRCSVLAGVGILLLALLGMWASGRLKVKTPDGTIVLENLPPDADVLVDGVTVTVKWGNGKTAEVRVAPGKKHRIQVKKEGFKVFGEEVEVDTGGSKPLLVSLEKLPKPIPPQPPLPPEKQVEAVVQKLRDLNPGFDGNVKPTIDDGCVKGLWFRIDDVKDLSPLRALPELKWLRLDSSDHKSDLADLNPLQGLPLSSLSISHSAISDLSPLSGMMELEYLSIIAAPLTDLKPLEGLKLRALSLHATQVEDLSPLKGMPLTELNIHRTRVKDLSPLKGMKLEVFAYYEQQVEDISVLKDMPLRDVGCTFQRERDETVLRSIKTLKTINGKPKAQFWKEVGSNTPAVENNAGRVGKALKVIAKDGFVPLFNGKDLDGWNPSPGSTWRVNESGALIGSGPTSSGLFTERGDFSDFHLRAQVMLGDGFNSRLLFRASGQTHYGVMIAGEPGPDQFPWPTGSLFREDTGDKGLRISPKVDLQRGKWFKLEILAQGAHFKVFVNDVGVVDYTDPDNTRNQGAIGLTRRPRSVVKFRKIEIKELRE